MCVSFQRKRNWETTANETTKIVALSMRGWTFFFFHSKIFFLSLVFLFFILHYKKNIHVLFFSFFFSFWIMILFFFYLSFCTHIWEENNIIWKKEKSLGFCGCSWEGSRDACICQVGWGILLYLTHTRVALYLDALCVHLSLFSQRAFFYFFTPFSQSAIYYMGKRTLWTWLCMYVYIYAQIRN